MSDAERAPCAPQRTIGFRRRRQIADCIIDAVDPDRGDPGALMSASTHPNLRDEKPKACERHIILPTRKIIFGLQQIEHRPQLAASTNTPVALAPLRKPRRLRLLSTKSLGKRLMPWPPSGGWKPGGSQS